MKRWSQRNPPAWPWVARLTALAIAMVWMASTPAPAEASTTAGNFYVLKTTSGSTYYVMRLHLLVQCPDILAKRVREIQWLEGSQEVRSSWGRLPAFEITRHPRGYQVLSGEETDDEGKPKVLAFVDLKGEYFDPDCGHYIRAEGIGFDQRFDIRNIRWPLEVWDRRSGSGGAGQ